MDTAQPGMAGDSTDHREHGASAERVRYYLVGFYSGTPLRGSFGRAFKMCRGALTDHTIKTWEIEISKYNSGERVVVMFTSEIEQFDDTQP